MLQPVRRPPPSTRASLSLRYLRCGIVGNTKQVSHREGSRAWSTSSAARTASRVSGQAMMYGGIMSRPTPPFFVHVEPERRGRVAHQVEQERLLVQVVDIGHPQLMCPLGAATTCGPIEPLPPPISTFTRAPLRGIPGTPWPDGSGTERARRATGRARLCRPD